MKPCELIQQIKDGALRDTLGMLYGANAVKSQEQRYIKSVERFCDIFPEREDVHIFSAPGRTEIGGNHTDHQHGCALGAAVNLDAVAVVSFRDDSAVRVHSEGYGMIELDLSDLEVNPAEFGKSSAIIRGIAARFSQLGLKTGGFDAYTTSDVLGGSGLSSSAAFETLIGAVFNINFNGGALSDVDIAKAGQYAENVYFGKGSGLLDQTVCSVGGFVFIDFNDTENPAVEKLFFDFDAAGYNLCVTDTKGSHSDLTDDYVAVPDEMKEVAARFDKPYLREVDEKEFFEKIPELHGKVGDRALLRAVHFFGENARAKAEAEALKNGDLDGFFKSFKQSAYSSANLLQNLYSTKKPREQGIPLAIAVSRLVLGEDAAVRVHGGGFAGTVQAFVPADKTEEYAASMNALFGDGSCYIIRIRPVGGVKII